MLANQGLTKENVERTALKETEMNLSSRKLLSK
jgi:hypothetical protein